MGRSATTAILLAAAPRPAQAISFWHCWDFDCLIILPMVLITLLLLGTSSCYFAHGCCSCATQDADPKSQRRHRVCVQSCACTNAVLAIVWTAIFGLLMMATGWWQQPVACLFFALAAVLGSLGADRRCKKGAADDADEPPVVAPKEPVCERGFPSANSQFASRAAVGGPGYSL